MVIGRIQGCGLKIPSGSVSRQHCRLSVADGIVHVEDLGSANGTLVNGDPVQWSVLRPGDLLTVGPITFKVDYPLTPDAVTRILDSKPTRPKPALFAGNKKKRVAHDEEALDAVSPEDSQAPIPMSEGWDLDEPRLHVMDQPTIPPADPEESAAEKPRKKKKKKKAASEAEDSSNPDYSMLMDGKAAWQAPTGENLRDLLSRLEEEE